MDCTGEKKIILGFTDKEFGFMDCTEEENEFLNCTEEEYMDCTVENMDSWIAF